MSRHIRPGSIAAGLYQSAALTGPAHPTLPEGSIVMWGDQSAGQRRGVPAGGGFIALAAGNVAMYAAHSDGSVVAFGNFDSRDRFAANLPTSIPAGVVKLVAGDFFGAILDGAGHIHTFGGAPIASPQGTFIDVAAGGNEGLAGVRTDGSLALLGPNSYGRWANAPTPSHRDFCRVVAGSKTFIAMRRDGTLVYIGDDDAGAFSGAPPATTAFRTLFAGRYHYAGTTRDGRTLAWGDSSSGQFRGFNVGTSVQIADGDGHYAGGGFIDTRGRLFQYGSDGGENALSGFPAEAGVDDAWGVTDERFVDLSGVPAGSNVYYGGANTHAIEVRLGRSLIWTKR